MNFIKKYFENRREIRENTQYFLAKIESYGPTVFKEMLGFAIIMDGVQFLVYEKLSGVYFGKMFVDGSPWYIDDTYDCGKLYKCLENLYKKQKLVKDNAANARAEETLLKFLPKK